MHGSLVILLVFLVAVFPLSAQTGTASLSGIVTDPSEAVVVNAVVQAVNVETNVSQATRTNESGLYSFPSLPPAHYRMSVRAPGFKELVEPGLILHVQDTVSLNFKMEVGATSESVTVSAVGAPVNTEDATVATVVERQVVANMPLNGRSFQGPHYTLPRRRHRGRIDSQYRTVRGERPAYGHELLFG